MQLNLIKNNIKKYLPAPLFKLLRNTWYFFFLLLDFICDNKKILIKENVAYIYIFKVANTSITKAMFFSNEDVDEKKSYFTMTESYRIVSCKKPKKCFAFSFVRNPFDKLYSCYKNKCVDNKPDNGIIFEWYMYDYVRNITSFESFIKKINIIPNAICEYHFKPQYSILYKNGECIADYIGRYENLEKDFEFIRQKFNFGKLPHLNKSQINNEWKDHYTKELAAIVYRKYKKDFETWYPEAYKDLLKYIDNNK